MTAPADTPVPVAVLYTFDGSHVTVHGDHRDGICTFTFVDPEEGPTLRLHFHLRTAVQQIAEAMPGYVAAGTFSQWWTERIVFLTAQAVKKAA